MSHEFDVVGLRAFTDNYIWVLRRHGNAVVVDPGDAAPVFEHLRTSGDKLAAILVTHRHPDHVGGVDLLCDRFDVPVFGPLAENIPRRNHAVSGGDRIEVPGLDGTWEVIDVGGHTRGHVAYYRPNVLLCGDALFVLGCGRLFDGTMPQMAASIARIAQLPRDTRVYCAHEYAHLNLPFALSVEPHNPLLQQRAAILREAIAAGHPTVPSTLGDELDTNPFLRCDADEVKQAAANFRGHVLTNRVDVFTALREWRNQL